MQGESLGSNIRELLCLPVQDGKDKSKLCGVLFIANRLHGYEIEIKRQTRLVRAGSKTNLAPLGIESSLLSYLLADPLALVLMKKI